MGNIALNKPATASTFVMPYAAANAVSGTITPLSRWLCNTLPCWMGVDTGSMYLVNRWVVRHMPVAGWQSPDYVNSDFKLQGSLNNSAWVDLDTVTNNSSSVTDRTIAPVAYRYFRVYVSKGLRTNTQLASIMEFEVYQAYSGQLTNLAISAGTLTPVFNTNTYTYTATVNSVVASINVTPTALSPKAVIKVNGTTVGSGQPLPVALNYGSNTITVNVTDGTAIQNYILTVTRPASCLSSLTVQSGSTNIPLTPAFSSGTQSYTASVANIVSGATFTPTAQKTSATITINGITVPSGQVSQLFPLAVGANAFPIQVISDGAIFPYTVTITRAGGEVSLLLDHVVVNYSGRTISPGSVTVPMNATDLIYSAKVPTGAGTITVSPFAKDSTVVIRVNNVVVASGGTSGSIALASSGVTAVSITVTSPDGSTTRSYTLNVNKG